MTTATLSSPSYVHTDPDYRRWILGLDAVSKALTIANPICAPAMLLPAALLSRGTTEASRRTVGAALHLVKDAFYWVSEGAECYRLEMQNAVSNLYRATRITVDGSLTLSSDGGASAMLRATGGMSIQVDPSSIAPIVLPPWLGGAKTVDHLLDLANLDASAVIDRDHALTAGQVSVLGGLATIGGSIDLDWNAAVVTAHGGMNILSGLVSATGEVKIGTSLGVVIQGSGSIDIPAGSPIFPRLHLASGHFMVNWAPELVPSKGFVSVWGDFLGIQLGMEVSFDGTQRWWGANELAATGAPAAGPADIGASADTLAAPGAVPYSQRYVVPSDTPWLMLITQWDNSAPGKTMTITTPTGQVLSEADIAASSSMALVPELCSDRRRAVKISNPAAGTWTVGVTDVTGLGTVNSTALVPMPSPAVAITSVTDGTLRRPIQIAFQTGSAAPESTVSLFYDTDGIGFDGVLIQDGLTAPGGSGNYTWDSAGVPAGTYHLYARILDGVNVPAMAYATATVTITDDNAPTGITVSSASIPENQGAGAAVGILETIDADAGDAFTYSLVSGTGSTDNGSFTISGSTLKTAASFNYEAKSSYSIRVRTTDLGGLYTEKSFTITVTDVDEIAPTVTAVYVRGSTWSSGYLSFLAANMSGSSSTYGYAVPVGSGAAQLQTLPWRNLNRISIAFSEDVSVAQAQFAIVGSAGSYTVSGFSYNATDHVATWSLSAVIGPDKLYVALPGTGSSPVRDAVGNLLDGEWNNPSSYSQVGSTDTFPSGNGTAGGDFAFRFDVLPGDSTGGSLGKVNVADVAQTKSRSTLAVTGSSYRSDFDGNNLINVADVAYVKSKSSVYSLPVNPPVMPVFGSSMPALTLSARIDLPVVPVFGPVFSQVSLLQRNRLLTL